MGFAHQLAFGAVEQHHTSGIAVNAHLMLEAAGLDIVGLAQAAIFLDPILGHGEQTDPLHPGRGIGNLAKTRCTMFSARS